mmetsp:Transcript_41169/g.56104  ORF Transcript_41169/g.56104 Transcript_41169/m.56104 type:complete len:257 (+) Transcript_41169:462-1232(+)
MKKGVRDALFPRARCPADPVDVVFDRERERKVDHRLYVGNVEPSSSYICGDEKGCLATFEGVHSNFSVSLVLVPVHSRTSPAILREHVLKSGGFLLVKGKHEDSVLTRRVVFLQQNSQPGLSLTIFNHLDNLSHPFVCSRFGVGRSDGDLNRRCEEFLGELLDRHGPGGGKHGCLSFLCGGTVRKDGPDVRQEAHVEHAIRFVQHHVVHLVKVAAPLLDEILQSTGSSYDHRHSLAKFLSLFHLRHPTIYAQRMDT